MSDSTGHDVLGTSVNTTNGAISAQIGDSVAREVSCDNAEWIQHVGFASRPSSAEPGKSACQVLSIETTGRDICYASRDLRGTAIYGALGAGETCIFANGPNTNGTGIVLLQDDGRDAVITLRVKRSNVSSGEPVTLKLKSNGKVEIVTGPCSVTIDGQNGSIVVQGQHVNLEAATVELGASAAAGVMLGPQTQTFLNSYQAIMVALAGALSGGGIMPGPVPASLVPLTTALTSNALLTPNVAATASTTVKAQA